MLKSSMFLENTNWPLRTRLDVKFPWKTPTLHMCHASLETAITVYAQWMGKNVDFTCFTTLGDGGLVTKNVCAYLQNWYHDGPSTTICWVPTSWWWWILSLEDVKGWGPVCIFSSLGLRLTLSVWGEANLPAGEKNGLLLISWETETSIQVSYLVCT